MGPNLVNVTRVLSRIEEINHRIMPDLYHAQHNTPLKSKFVEVMNEVNNAGRKVRSSRSTIVLFFI